VHLCTCALTSSAADVDGRYAVVGGCLMPENEQSHAPAPQIPSAPDSANPLSAEDQPRPRSGPVSRRAILKVGAGIAAFVPVGILLLQKVPDAARAATDLLKGGAQFGPKPEGYVLCSRVRCATIFTHDECFNGGYGAGNVKCVDAFNAGVVCKCTRTTSCQAACFS
jgi:hypothetical protein